MNSANTNQSSTDSNLFKNKIKKINSSPSFNLRKNTRYDSNGNVITHNGKQKISFLDKVSHNGIAEVIDIDNYKEYNKVEAPSSNPKSGCCLIY